MVPNILTNQSGSGGGFGKNCSNVWMGGGGGHKWVNPILGEFANRIANMTAGIINLGLKPRVLNCFEYTVWVPSFFTDIDTYEYIGSVSLT
jgi:hypothetical protein